ncbi:MAG: DUF2207 domain-containing protein [Chitinophagaceae bacterium]|nr:DUF2207 domain-containing protein [Chitinophagaceae bacterium]
MIFPKDFLTETKFSEQVPLKSFTVKKYDIYVKVNKNATLDVTETIHLHFNKSEESFYRIFKPQRFRYPFKALLWSEVDEVMTSQIPRPHPPAIKNIVVDNQDFSVRDFSGFLKTIDIKSKAGGFTGDQQFIIKYRIIDAIDFFEDHSELYFSFIDAATNAIDTVSFSVELYKALPDQPISFVRTGINSFRQNNLSGKWANNKIFSGTTTARFEPGQELTAGINFPKDFITQPNYNLRGIEWLIAPGVIFIIMFIIWMIWGKDDKVTIQTEFYPPDSISPNVAGYLIDNRLNRRDLTALIPYWGANGYLKVTEEDRDVLGVYKKKKYFLKKLKELPANVMAFEKTLFNGIFAWKNPVELSDLKNSLYTTMDTAKGQLEAEIDSQAYYVKNSRKIGKTIILAIAVLIVYAGGFIIIGLISEGTIWQAAALIFSLIILVLFALLMPKKTKKAMRSIAN